MKHSVWRNRKTQKRYYQHVSQKQPDAPCEFCLLHIGDGQVLEDRETFWLVKNIFPYTIWDNFYVDEHLMVIPKRHVDSIGSFTDKELKAYGKLLAQYEDDGYSVYGRAANNSAKSVAHQHTHLIKVSNRRVKTLIFLDRFNFTLFR